MKIGLKTILVLTLMSGISCNDWMEQLPPQGLIREEFWKTKEDVDAVIMGGYITFASMDGLLFKYGEMRGDMVKGGINQSLDEQKIMEGNIYPENAMCEWNKFYQVINDCNDVIKFAPKVQAIDNTFSDYLLDGYLSEAYFLRSLSYFYLVRIFKDVPLVLEPTETDASNIYVPKTNGDDVLAQIKQDLESVRNYATIDGYQTPSENKGRATKAAIDALLADIDLWTFDYEGCISQVDNIITSSGHYELMPRSKWFEIFYPGNSLEGIFEFQFDDNLGQKNTTNGLTQLNSHNYLPSDHALELFGKLNAKEIVRGEDISIKKYSDVDYIIWKYIGRAPDGETTRSGSDQNSCNWIVYRLADVLLMKAEALSQLGRFGEALQILNDIRLRAGVPTLNPPESKIAYEDAILEERALELAYEGKRWFDLLRMGRRNDFSRKSKLIEIIVKNVPSTQKRILAAKLTNPMGWYLPVYEKELERNKNLVQNPYYNF